jgi:hypothetical protein
MKAESHTPQTGLDAASNRLESIPGEAAIPAVTSLTSGTTQSIFAASPTDDTYYDIANIPAMPGINVLQVGSISLYHECMQIDIIQLTENMCLAKHAID